MKDEYKITNMSLEELLMVAGWAEREGWNPGLNDARCFYATDPNGFYIGKLNSKPIAAGSAVIYDADFAFCGYYMVDPDFRNSGFGLTLTKRRLEYIGDRNAGIDGVLTMLDKYKNLGYEIAHFNTRYSGKNLSLSAPEFTVTPIQEIPVVQINAYDRRHFPAPREKLLNCWLHQEQGSGYGVILENKLCGYGYIRPSVDGYRIGPLFADNRDIAHAIFCSLIKSIGDNQFYIDCPEVNTDAIAIAKNYNLEEVFRSARMYLKYEPDIAIQNVYAITSLELG